MKAGRPSVTQRQLINGVIALLFLGCPITRSPFSSRLTRGQRSEEMVARCDSRRFVGDATITCVVATPTHLIAGADKHIGYFTIAREAVHRLRVRL